LTFLLLNFVVSTSASDCLVCGVTCNMSSGTLNLAQSRRKLFRWHLHYQSEKSKKTFSPSLFAAASVKVAQAA